MVDPLVIPLGSMAGEHVAQEGSRETWELEVAGEERTDSIVEPQRHSGLEGYSK
jgi:hypothetical protein